MSDEREELKLQLLKLGVKELESPWHTKASLWVSIISIMIALAAVLLQGSLARKELILAEIKKEHAIDATKEAEIKKENAIKVTKQALKAKENAITATKEAERLTKEAQQKFERLTYSYADLEKRYDSAQTDLEVIEKSVLQYEERLAALEKSLPKENFAFLLETVEIVSSKKRTRESHKALVHDGTKARLFFFVANASQRKQVEKIEGSLNSRKLYVANILTNKWKTPSSTEVRYFRYPDDKEEAEKILQVLQQNFGWKNIRTSYVIDPDSVGEGRKFQIWLSSSAP